MQHESNWIWKHSDFNWLCSKISPDTAHEYWFHELFSLGVVSIEGRFTHETKGNENI